MEEIDFESDKFEDILAKDSRYSPKAYALLMDVVEFLLESSGGKSLRGEEILEEFRARALDQYGPLTYRVLTEWGVTCCEYVGEMVFNLTDSKRLKKEEDDTPEAFTGGYDFEEAFLDPFAADD